MLPLMSISNNRKLREEYISQTAPDECTSLDIQAEPHRGRRGVKMHADVEEIVSLSTLGRNSCRMRQGDFVTSSYKHERKIE